jgi:hypothetical protein
LFRITDSGPAQASVPERPVALPPEEGSVPMPDPSAKFFYRILPNGSGWYWEILDSENGVVSRGVANERVPARAAAFEAVFDHLKTIPEPYPEGIKRCPDTSSI